MKQLWSKDEVEMLASKIRGKIMKQGGTELCQAQVKLEVTVTIVVEARRSLAYFIRWLGGQLGGWVAVSTENITISSFN